MKIIFISNFYNHHQATLCENFYFLTDGNFVFIQTGQMNETRKKMGWGISNLPNFVKEISLNKKIDDEILKLICDADVIIIGGCKKFERQLPKKKIKNKLIFRYSERIYKNNSKFLTLPLRFIKYHWDNGFSKKIYMLCASAYAAADYAKTFNFIGKTFKWGYFPEIEKKDVEELCKLKQNNRKIEMLWVGRMLQLKHPEYAIYAAKHLKGKRREFHLTMIGDGDQAQTIKKLAEENGVAENVDFLGFMPPEKVREYMQKADIFLFTSDFNEGWGAVLNESMGSACAVVASHAIGSVPFLLKDGENGMIYTYGNVNEFCEKTDKLVTDQVLRNKLQQKAYETIFNEWNANIAAKRLIELSEALLKGQPLPDYDTGPCSRAEILKNNWFLRNKQ